MADPTIEMFFDEAGDLMQECEHALLCLEHDPSASEQVDVIFRAVHSIKGTAGMLGFEQVAMCCHALEGLLARIRKGTETLVPRVVGVLLRAVDMLRELLAAARRGEVVSAGRVNPMLEELGDRAAAPSGDTGEAGLFEATDAPVAEVSKESARHLDRASVRVPVERIDRLVNLVGELVIAQSMLRLTAASSTSAGAELDEAVAYMDRHVRELQERVMAMRMLPVRTVFDRQARLVHDLGEAQGKSVVLDVSGEDTELDKGLIDRISDPLMHLVRNAVDHGLETPDVRRARGKREAGRLGLRAYQEGGAIHVEVSDDGRGLERDAILHRARQLGLVGAGASPADEDVHALIFRPGFSTATTVSQISGRGVGLDVVRRNVEALGGRISIRTEPGQGTTFHITLPLTLAILDGQLVRVGDQIYLLPLSTIVESLKPRPGQVRRLIGQAEVVVVRNVGVPLFRLHRLFGVAPAVEDPLLGIVVVVEHAGAAVALLFDELLGQQQVVIKSLETHFQKLPGVEAATILGDGRVALILDVAGLVNLARSAPPLARRDPEDAPPLATR